MDINPSPEVIRHESAEILSEIIKVYAMSLEQLSQWQAAASVRALGGVAIPAIRRGDPDWLPNYGSQSS